MHFCFQKPQCGRNPGCSGHIFQHIDLHMQTEALQRDINKGYALIGLAMILKKGEGFHCESTVGEPLSVSSLWH